MQQNNLLKVINSALIFPFRNRPVRYAARFWTALIGSACLALVLLLAPAGGLHRVGWAQAEPVPQDRAEPPSRLKQMSPWHRVSRDPALGLGDSGPRVQALHRQLEALGYDLGHSLSGPSNRVGQFGDRTEQAVLAFQRSAGIAVDGIVGAETQRALEQQQPDSASTALSQTASLGDDFLESNFMPPDLEAILARGKLTVAVLGQDNPPFFMTDPSGQLLGSDVALAQQLAEQLGVELVFRRTAQTFNEVVDQVYRHEADLAISKLSRTLKRARKVRFSQPYLKMRQGLLVNRVQFAEKAKGESMPEMLRSLEGRIGVIRGTSYGGFAKQKFPQATVVEYPTWTQAIKAVRDGNIVAAYRDELEVKKIVRNNPDASLQFQTIALTDAQDPLSVVLPWNSDHLSRFVDLYLESAYSTPTVDGLLDNYLAHL